MTAGTTSEKKAFYADPDEKPKLAPPNPDGIPDELRALPRWVAWALVWKSDRSGGSWTKVPLSRKTGRPGDCNAPRNWGTFRECLDFVGAGKADGVGFAFTDGGYIGIDLDDHRDPGTGRLTEFAQFVAVTFATYCEVSASGTGVKLIGRGAFPPGTPKKVKELGVELFDCGFFALTGGAVPGTTADVVDVQPAIDGHLADLIGGRDLTQVDTLKLRDGGERRESAAHSSDGDRTQPDTSKGAREDARESGGTSTGGTKKVPTADEVEARVRSHPEGERLMNGGTGDHDDDHSSADLALCNLICFYALGRADLIDAVFKRSKLNRDKWDAKHARDGRTYGQMTVAKAIDGKREFFDWDSTIKVTVKGTTSPGAEPLPAPPPVWPTMAADAFQGLPGEFVAMIHEQTESDPVALLLQFLVAFGSAVGRGPHRKVEFTRHGANENLVIVGQSAKGRKGTSWNWIDGVFRLAAPEWAAHRQLSGVGSGEGVIYNLRDPVFKTNDDGERVCADDGVTDKRLLIQESEFASILRVIERPGGTISPILRAAWDGGKLQNAVKNSPLVATDGHVSVIGHVTTDELVRLLTASEVANGFGNRHLFALVRRSKELPHGGRIPEELIAAFAAKVTDRLAVAGATGLVCYDADAAALWTARYSHLSRDRYGLAGTLSNRAEAHVTRLALIYALADGAAVIGVPHLTAAFAAWDYCEASVRYVFGDATGDGLADQIRGFMRAWACGLSRTEISAALGRNVPSSEIARALGVLAAAGLARMEKRTDTGGKPAEVWVAVGVGG